MERCRSCDEVTRILVAERVHMGYGVVFAFRCPEEKLLHGGVRAWAGWREREPGNPHRSNTTELLVLS